MRITKFGHACVRIQHEGVEVVIDPGAFTEAEAVDGATAVLITHEHPDHYLAEHLARTDAPIFTVGAVAEKIREEAPDLAERVSVVTPGQRFDAGLPVRAVGELHAVIHQDYPRISNSGYLLEVDGRRLYHPGDALTAPGEPVDLLFAPISAPWLKIGEAVDFVREVAAPRSLGIHDKVYSELALGMVDTHMGNLLPAGQEFLRVGDGADL